MVGLCSQGKLPKLHNPGSSVCNCSMTNMLPPPLPPDIACAGVRSLLSRMVHHGGGSGGDGSDDSFDLVNLCSTFGSDPFVMSFAHVSVDRQKPQINTASLLFVAAWLCY